MSTLADGEPHVSDHAADRWDERTDDDSVAPEAAWGRAQRVAGAEHHARADEVRAFAPERVVLLRRGNTILTVLSEGEMDDDLRRAVAPVLPSHL